ncbi:MAG: hypothetical protein M5R40_29085 [Anaerolineae bacterium]|nr:hypothetical protein [Anaerolineae bacterium]
MITGPRAAELLFEQGFFPAAEVDPEMLTEGTVVADQFAVWNAVNEANAVGHWLDWTLPSVDANIQELMGGVATPGDFRRRRRGRVPGGRVNCPWHRDVIHMRGLASPAPSLIPSSMAGGR